MRIKVHRGQNQIGGNIIEIASGKTKILLDIGIELDEDNITLPQVDGLFDTKGYDAIFISHYHSDHMGLAYMINKDIPIYMGEDSYKVTLASNTYKNIDTFPVHKFIYNGKVIEVGDIRLIPYLADHSAYDSYMFLIEAENKKILYTGDFRSNGRKPYNILINNLPDKVDAIITEGTNVTRTENENLNESDLEEKAVQIIKHKSGPIFILQSSMNIDRIVTIYRAGKRCSRILLQDLYMAEITSAIRKSIPNPKAFNDVKVFLTRPYDKDHFRYKLFNKYSNKKIGKAQITKITFIMCVRASMKNYLKSLNKDMSFNDGVLFYSIWNGYKSSEEMKEFLEFTESTGLETIYLHTSGHADIKALKELINHVNPDIIIPIHTENAVWFNDNFKEKKVVSDKIIYL